METLEYILNKYKIGYDEGGCMPIEIPNVGRNDLAVLFKELGYKVGAEIGVEQGQYSEVLCKSNPEAKLYSIDEWQRYKKYRDHVDQNKLNMFYERTRERLSPYNCEIIKGFSMDVVKQFEDESLDFVYIDSNHCFESVTEDVSAWSKKVRMGGIVSGHDYKKYAKPALIHVAEVIDAYTECYSIRPVFVMGRRHVDPGEHRDGSRSWFWVKSPIPTMRGRPRQ